MIKGIIPALAEGGKIKIGGLGEERTSKSGKKFRMPVKLDHFLVTRTTRDEAGDLDLDEALMGALPKDHDGQIRAIPIVLHSDVIDEVFPTTYALYSGRKLACRGDGEAATRWAFQNGNRTSATKEIKCPCELLRATNGPCCKPHGTLHCSIVAEGQAVAGAVHKWRTTSLISIQRMIGSLQQILATCGTMRGLPLWLKLEAIQVQPDGVGASTVYCCHVELRAKDLLSVQQKALELAQMRKALAGDDGAIRTAYRALIEAPANDHETAAEQEEIAAEFYPEDVDAEHVDQATGELKDGVHKLRGKPQVIPAEPTPEPLAAKKPEPEKPVMQATSARREPPKGQTGELGW